MPRHVPRIRRDDWYVHQGLPGSRRGAPKPRADQNRQDAPPPHATWAGHARRLARVPRRVSRIRHDGWDVHQGLPGSRRGGPKPRADQNHQNAPPPHATWAGRARRLARMPRHVPRIRRDGWDVHQGPPGSRRGGPPSSATPNRRNAQQGHATRAGRARLARHRGLPSDATGLGGWCCPYQPPAMQYHPGDPTRARTWTHIASPAACTASDGMAGFPPCRRSPDCPVIPGLRTPNHATSTYRDADDASRFRLGAGGTPLA